MPYCRHCGTELSPVAASCPRCGRPATGIAEVAISYGAPPLRLAGFWLRLVGYVIDAIIVTFISQALIRAFEIRAVVHSDCPGISIVCGPRRFAGLHLDAGALLARQAIAAAVFVGYTSLMLALNDGRTLGALATGLRVARPDGTRISAGQALGRQVFSRVSRSVLFLGYLWAAWEPQRRTWHDAVANTRVFATR